jgi:hypothetical protein
MNTIIVVLGALAALLWLASAIYWALSARVKIRDNQDAFISDLHRAARWNAWAAWSACAAAVCSVGVEILRAM